MAGSAKLALLGAAAGSIITLLLHPVSRPYLGVVFWHPPEIDSDTPLPGEIPIRLDKPSTLLDASIWMQAACERYRLNVPLRKTEVASAVRVAENAADTDPNNAYWKQMAAVFLSQAGRDSESDAYWEKASRCASWNDFQTKRLLLMRTGLISRYRTSQSWQLARLYRERSSAPAKQIESFARRRLDTVPLDTVPGLLERYATLRNGNLIRQFSKSLAVGISGASIVDLSAVSESTPTSHAVRRTEAARSNFVRLLQRSGYAGLAVEAQKEFKENEAWLRFINERDAAGNINRLGIASIFTATAPSAMLALALIGLALTWLGTVIDKSEAIQAALRYPAVFSIGLSMAFGAYALTFTPLAGCAIGLSAAFLAFTPKSERARPPSDLGPFFKFAIGFLAIAFMGLMGFYFILRTPPSVQVLGGMNFGSEADVGLPALAGLAFLVVGLIMLMSPFWAYAQRLRTTRVLSIGLQSFGSLIVTVCLTGSILMTLLGIYFDHALSNTLSELMQNEPLHYSLERG